MNIFYRPKYESDVTQFLNALKASRPEVEVGQRQGHRLLWDKTIDRQAQQQFRQARVAQQAYVYQCSGRQADDEI